MDIYENSTCQGCGRQCPLTSLSCNRGRRLNGQKEIPESEEGIKKHRSERSNEYDELRRHDAHDAHHGHERHNNNFEEDLYRKCNKNISNEESFSLRPQCEKRFERNNPEILKMRQAHYQSMTMDEKLRENFRQIGHVLYHLMDDHGGQYRALAILNSHGEISQRDLMELLDVRPGSVSELLTKLESSGLITRSTNPDDHRGVNVCLTEAGRTVCMEHKAKRQKQTKSLFETFNDSEKEEMNTSLEKLINDWHLLFNEENTADSNEKNKPQDQASKPNMDSPSPAS